jgi:hypothetical protein
MKEVVLHHGGSSPQMRFWQSNAKFRAFVGGIGSGKTRAGTVEVLRQPENTRGMIVAPTYRMLEDTVIETFREIARPFLKGDLVRRDMTWELVNGTKVLFRSAEEPDRLRGPNLGWFWADEAAMMGKETFDILMGRLRLGPGRGWVTTTPRGFNWLYDMFVKDRRRGFELVRCSTAENVFLPEDYVESLAENYSGAWRAQEFGGEFVEWVNRPAYEDFNESRNLGRDLLEKYYRPDLPLLVQCDFNVALLSWPIGQFIDDQFIIYSEATVEDSVSIPKAVAAFRAQFPNHSGEVHFYGDASGYARNRQTTRSDWEAIEIAMRDYPSKARVYANRRNPSPRDRILAVNHALAGLHCKPTLIDDNRCPVLIRDFKMCEWNPNGDDIKKVTNPNDDAYLLSHSSDGHGYLVSSLRPVSMASMRKKMQSEIAAQGGAVVTLPDGTLVRSKVKKGSPRRRRFTGYRGL